MMIFKNPLILVVDDQPDNLHVMVYALRSQYRLKTATDGMTALELAAKEDKPDIILLDLMMPGMDGYEVLRRLRENRSTRSIPVIFVTADHLVESERMGLDLGVDDYLTKPVVIPVLIARVRNLLQRTQSEARLRLFQHVVAQSHDGILVTDERTNILFVNQSFIEIMGYEEDELIGNNPRLLSSGKHDQDFYRQLWQVLHDDGYWQGEIWNRRKDGTVFPEWITISAVYDDNGSVTNYIGVTSDISERKRLEDKLAFLAHHDPLTGLPNRSVLESHLTMAMAGAHRQNTMLAVGILDLDNFKQINDTYGHSSGDQVLQAVSSGMRAALRGNDLLVRLGGDEFVIVIENLNSIDELSVLMDRLRAAIVAVVNLTGYDDVAVQVDASLGMVIYPDVDGAPDFLLREADQVLYQMKALKGRRDRWWAVRESLTQPPIPPLVERRDGRYF